MCQPLVCARLVEVVGDVTETPRLWDFETLEDIGCSNVERPKGPKDGAMWKDGFQDSERSHA